MFSTLLGIAGILAGVYLYKLARLKLLDYSMRADEAIVTDAAKRAGSELSVAWAGTALREPRVSTLRIANTGRLAVKREDYDDAGRPLVVRQPGNKIVAAVLSSARFIEVTVGPVEDDGQRLTVFPLGHFNPGAWFDLKVISDGPGGPFEVATRFADQSAAPYLVRTEPPHGVRFIPGVVWRLGHGLFVAGILVMTALVVYEALKYDGDETPSYISALIVGSLSVAGLAGSVVFAYVVWEELVMVRARRLMSAKSDNAEPPTSTRWRRWFRALSNWLRRPA